MKSSRNTRTPGYQFLFFSQGSRHHISYRAINRRFS